MTVAPQRQGRRFAFAVRRLRPSHADLPMEGDGLVPSRPPFRRVRSAPYESTSLARD